MTRKNAVLLSVAVLCVIGAVWHYTRQSGKARAGTEDFPEGTFWLCQSCNAEFAKTLSELAELRRQLDAAEGPGLALRVACPECDSPETERAIRCPFCKRFYARVGAGRRPVCPHCNKELPPLAKVREQGPD